MSPSQENATFLDLLSSSVREARVPQMLCTAGGAVLAVSRAFTDITGRAVESFPSVVDWLVKDNHLVEERARLVASSLTEEEAGSDPCLPVEVAVWTRNGNTRRWLFSRVQAFAEDKERYVVLSAVDVTELEKNELGFPERETFFFRLFQALPTILYVFDIEKKGPVFESRHAGENLGFTPEEVLEMGDRFLTERMHPEDFARFPDHIDKLMRARDSEVLTFEFRMRHKNGEWLHTVSFDTVFKRNDEGRMTQFLGIANDITELKRAEEEKLKMSLQVQELQKMESLAMLAGVIAHDFNNLLVGIMGSADLIKLALPEGSSVDKDLERIRDTSAECAELCKQLLAYAGKGRFVVEPIHLRRVVEEIGHLLRVSISKNAALRYNFNDDLPPVQADVRQIRQVVMNLIKNASDAIGKNSGIITVAIDGVEASRSYLESSFGAGDLKEGYYVTLEVSDTGCGIEKESLPRIFEPFFSSKQEGRGLGLAAVLGIIKSHGGAIRVYSEMGKGSSFKVLLPACHEPDGKCRKQTEHATTSFDGGTVLVVDDEEVVRDVLIGSLKTMGFSVLTASTGGDALAIFEEHTEEIRVVLLDMMMPGMGGAAAFQRLRQIDPDVKVILMSGYNEQDATNDFIGRGLAGFLHKPFRHAELVQALRKVLLEKQTKPNE